MSEKKNKRLIIFVCILLVLGGYGCFLLYYNLYFSKLTEIEKWGIIPYMEKKVNLAIETAHEKYDIELDRSPESIEKVEQILEQLHSRHVENPVHESVIVRESSMWGAYIGEVINSQINSKWEYDPQTMVICLQLVKDNRQYELIPGAWCYRRIHRGDPEDNVWLKFLYITVDPNSSQSELVEALELQIQSSDK